MMSPGVARDLTDVDDDDADFNIVDITNIMIMVIPNENKPFLR